MKCLKKNDTINLILFFNSTNGGSVLGAKEPGQSFLDKIFRKKDDNVTDEIKNIVQEGHQQGELLDSEAEMITNIIEFGDKEAHDIMTHRKNIVAIDADTTIKDCFEFVLGENYSRFPVYEGDIDHIIGVMHLRDLLKIYADSYKRNHTIYELKDEMLFDPHFIPETRNINALFKSMQSEKVHMAVVVDEYGQTTGIVTMEDILEEIVGNIMDEYDVEEQYIVRDSDGSYIMDGYTQLDDIEDMLNISFADEDSDTLSGFIISRMEHLPEDNEQFEVWYSGYRFSVLEVDNKRVKKVRVTYEPHDEEGEEE
ncbi:CBS domain protein [[Bacteroides] pectinophilus ATCC 43243]|uniref:CBS domain-containing protein n=1 Tax=[Bacteroides] pectinophilus ATCC 43243 TaxID=483218 RepID=B7AQP8_9FIRM|nr:CBS domain protein [[Bacteroides] pectinophilus ATCC 43243]